MQKYLLAILLILSSLPLPAQTEKLFGLFKRAARFDFNYPREKVYLHLDNTAYLEGETIWFKAYVVRASTLHPHPLSRVLYVEILNDAGQTMDRLTLRLDSLGQGHGQIELKDMYKSGFYEIRAFTREMLNWGDNACFSRVVPVAAKKGNDEGEVQRPTDFTDLPENAARPFFFGNRRKAILTFYPEGGNRVAGIRQRIAYRLINGRGEMRTDTFGIYTPDDELITLTAPEHEGLGTFTLPASAPADGCYAKVGNNKFPLPLAPADSLLLGEVPVAMTCIHESDGIVITVDAGTNATPLMGLAVFCREQVCFFDTLSVAAGVPVEYFLPREKLRGGVNRIELFSTSGLSLATRLVWCPVATDRRLQFSVRQNKTAYDPFTPIAIDMQLNDPEGNPVQTTFSLAVRDAASNLVANPVGGISEHFLLSSELRGYISHPEYYFANETPARRQALDLLLMVQGWAATDFEALCARRPFHIAYPIEDRLVLDGTIYKENNRFEPRPGFHVNLTMYNQKGEVLRGQAVTDSLGRFTFASAVDFEGDNWLANFTMLNEEGKKRWSRLALNRWFSPSIRPYDVRQMELDPPHTFADSLARHPLADEALFAWRDTLGGVQKVLGEVVVKAKRKYHGFTGNRLTYNGGEEAGLRHANIYYNFIREVERYKDSGRDPGTFHQFYNYLTSRATDPYTNPNSESQPESGPSAADGFGEKMHSNATDPLYEGSHLIDPTIVEQKIKYRERDATTYLNNDASQAAMLLSEMMADEVKSVIISRHDGVRIYVYEVPEYYRYKSSRGKERRRISGFTTPRRFFSPDYRGDDVPDAADVRRTLYWNPSITTDATGHASAVFFNNARPGTQLSISAQGVTDNGFVQFER